ncbi:MAG TPA: HAMP domain-containing sensor histidine kinase [Dissulfurispiraceae bacterium]|nr:HAMP domain-containing sensor histidine kinase [Dissulfurispiraceae bacterium]
MLKNLWIKFLVLLIAVSLIALSAALLLRELMLKDFREYLEGEREDRIYWITAAMESSYDKNEGWLRKDVSENMIWALMLGYDVKLYDVNGTLVIETENAIDEQSQAVVRRIMALSDFDERRTAEKFIPYPLFLGGEQIGRLDVGLLRPRKEGVFVNRSNRLLLYSLFALGGIALFLSVVFSRMLTNPIKRLTNAATDISSGNLKSRVNIGGRGEIAELADAFNRMAQSLEMQDSLRRKLTTNIAHELRTPLSAIRGELEAMIDGLIPLDREHIQSLYAEIGRLKKIIEGIEELAQAEASSRYLRKTVFDLRQFLEGIVERFGRLFDESGVKLELHCDDKLRITADPDRLSQIIINLLSNALKASQRGGFVMIKAAAVHNKTVISVSDNGSGIKKEDMQLIFERFFRGSKGGLGIGLTIVKELVEAHGGTINVESEYGKGTVFTLTLPE